MNPIKVRIMREVAETAGIKPCCFLPECSATGPFACGARARAMERVRLPSNFKSDYDQERRLSKASARRRAWSKQTTAHGGRAACLVREEPRHVQEVHQGPMPAPHVRHLPAPRRLRPAASRMVNREQTGKVACHLKGACSDMGCPYLHPPERQAMAVDVNGDLIATNA